MSGKGALERHFERLIFRARWLMVPFYVGLIVTLAMLLFHFIMDLVAGVLTLPGMTDKDLIVLILKLIDLSLGGNLLVVVVLAGYENFVSRMEGVSEAERAGWMGKVDFSGLKLKLIGSIVAISAVHLLQEFMSMHDVDKTDLAWMLAIHGMFVLSGVVLALMDRIAGNMKDGAAS